MDLREQARLQQIIRKDRGDIVALKRELAMKGAQIAVLEAENAHFCELLGDGLSPDDKRRMLELLRTQAAWDAKHPRQKKRA